MNRRDFARSAASFVIAQASHSFAQEQRGVRFSFMLWALQKLAPFDRCLEIVSQAGYQGVELVGEFQSWSPMERSRFLSRLSSLGLVVDAMSGVKAGFAVPQETAAFRTQFTQHLESAGELSCERVILLSGRKMDGLASGVQRQTALENLRWAAGKAAQARIEVLIEPIDLLENPAIYLSTVTDGFEWVRAIGLPNLRVLYDVYHEQRSYGNLIEKLERNIDLVGLIHVADVPGRHEPGSGEIHYEAIFHTLKTLGYNRWIAMEYYPTEDPVISLRRSRIQAQQALLR